MDNGMLSCEDQYQAIERPMSLRNEERLRYYENASTIHLKRPFQRRFVSPGSPSEFYPKRALYTSSQSQELVPSTSRGRLPIRRSMNEHVGRNDLQLTHPSNFVHHDASSPDGVEEMQFFVEDQNGQLMQYEEDFPNGEEEDEFGWQQEVFQENEEGDFSFINDELEDQEEEEQPVEHHAPVKTK